MLMAPLERLERRLPEAKEALGNAALFAVEHRQGQHALAQAQLQMGEASRAVDLLEGLAAKDPRDGETRRLLARALAASGQVEAAARRLAEAGRPVRRRPGARVPGRHGVPVDEEARGGRAAVRPRARGAADPADPRPHRARPGATPANTIARAPCCGPRSTRTRGCAAPTTTSAWSCSPTRAPARPVSTRRSRSSGRS